MTERLLWIGLKQAGWVAPLFPSHLTDAIQLLSDGVHVCFWVSDLVASSLHLPTKDSFHHRVGDLISRQILLADWVLHISSHDVRAILQSERVEYRIVRHLSAIVIELNVAWVKVRVSLQFQESHIPRQLPLLQLDHSAGLASLDGQANSSTSLFVYVTHF